MCGGTRERGVAGGMKQETKVVLSTDEQKRGSINIQ